MKNLTTTFRDILTLLTIGTTFQLSAQSNGKDTTFIFKDTSGKEIHSIFIDNSKESKFYDSISNFNFQHLHNDSYKNSIDFFKKQKLSFTKAEPVIPWTNWVTLKQYKGNFYAYHPNDFLYHFRQSVNDSTFIDWEGEGPVANKIIEQKKINSKTYEYKLTGIYDQDKKIIIHIIDNKKGIAVFEQSTKGKDNKYYLMIAADKIKSVPIIVNYSPQQKQKELEFDKPDFKLLLKSK